MSGSPHGRDRGRLASPALRSGLTRARDAVGPIAWTSLAAGLSYFLAGLLLGHPYPFYAAVAAFSALGFSPDVQPRRVGEVAFGISIGVAMGELIQHVFGSGPLQTTVVVFIAALIARVLDPSPVITTQAAVQSIVVLGLPAAATTGGPIGRWTEALLGGLVALTFSLFLPKDPRRRPRRLARDTLTQLADACDLLARGLRAGDGALAREALDRARRTQSGLGIWGDAVAASSSTARISPAWRRHASDLVLLADAWEYTDRTIRTARVLARRGAVAVESGFVDPALAGLVGELGLALRRLGAAFAAGEDPARVVPELVDLAGRLGTRTERDPVRHALVSLLRSATFDTLRAAGATEADAVRALAPR